MARQVSEDIEDLSPWDSETVLQCKCGKYFTYPQRYLEKYDNYYCSQKCTGDTTKSGDYTGFAKKRKEALERDSYTCQFCGSFSNTVHHIKGVENGHKLEDLVTLCRFCHDIFEGKKERKQHNLLNNTF